VSSWAASARTRPASQLSKTETYTRACAESKGFLILLSDGQHLSGAYALGREAGEWPQQAMAIRARCRSRSGATRSSRSRPSPRFTSKRAQGAAGGDRDGPAADECWREMSPPRPRRVLGLTRLWKEPW
jgi:hypothetical protein